MPRKSPKIDPLAARRAAPMAVEFQIVRASVAYEKAVRRAETAKDTAGRAANIFEGQCLKAWRRLRRLTSMLVDQ